MAWSATLRGRATAAVRSGTSDEGSCGPCQAPGPQRGTRPSSGSGARALRPGALLGRCRGLQAAHASAPARDCRTRHARRRIGSPRGQPAPAILDAWPRGRRCVEPRWRRRERPKPVHRGSNDRGAPPRSRQRTCARWHRPRSGPWRRRCARLAAPPRGRWRPHGDPPASRPCPADPRAPDCSRRGGDEANARASQRRLRTPCRMPMARAGDAAACDRRVCEVDGRPARSGPAHRGTCCRRIASTWLLAWAMSAGNKASRVLVARSRKFTSLQRGAWLRRALAR